MKRYWIVAIIVLIVMLVGGGALLMFYRNKNNRPKPAKAPTITGRYVALGDSVAAGLGLKTASDATYCRRTAESYPYAVAQNIHAHLQDAACRDATVTAGLLETQTSNDAKLAPQLNMAFTGEKPRLITITAGANDIGWSEILRRCYTATCGSAADSASVTAKLATLNTNIRATLDHIKQKYSDETPRVVWTGYYQIFPAAPQADCFELAGINAEELTWWNAQTKALNGTIASAVKEYPFARFAALDFQDNTLCADEPWVQSIQDNAPLHPTADGQAAISRAVVKASK